ncbi:MAG: hypothetical protein ACI9Y1_002431 [Lentisphaeria bacterium]|jgi:hypothetical protein
MYELDIEEGVSLDNRRLDVQLSDAKVTLHLDKGKKNGLAWTCTCRKKTCVHIGAVFSPVLEEKTPLGLAKAPPESNEFLPLSDEALRQHALDERQVRAAKEKMRVKSLTPKVLWSDYLVTNAQSGKAYRVALQGQTPGESYCSCPDFRKNTLGTCKHILHTLTKVKKRYPVAT